MTGEFQRIQDKILSTNKYLMVDTMTPDYARIIQRDVFLVKSRYDF